ncbi:ribonuclease R [Yunchengibacter salinarum]|uniref:ribonuclease R n=1 Tax=Yunchengibacter salinarum TaxID=3133399 RepID=UPI0035B68450
MAKDKKTAKTPDKQAILDYVSKADGKVTKRDIARHFGVKGPDKVQLKKTLRQLKDDGLLAQDHHRALRPADQLPAVQVVEFAGLDEDGEALVRPSRWDGDGDPPTIYLREDRRGRSGALGPGERGLARLTLLDGDPPSYRARLMKKFDRTPSQVLGVFQGHQDGGRILPADKKDRDEYLVLAEDVHGARHGELVLADVKGGRKRMGLKQAVVKTRMGNVSDARSISMIAIHAHDIPHEFPDRVIAAAEAAKPVSPEGRTDLRSFPLITIDPADARDHDDAIFAEPDTDPENPGGFHAIVAIADVAHYVRPGSALDKEAFKRGNSCYFPDRVVPMLPEALSADLCSLKPGVDRACMAVHMWFDAKGRKTRHKFVRGIMNSRANITYRQAQNAIDGIPDEASDALAKDVIHPIHACWQAMMVERKRRGPLELDLPERKIELDDRGHVKAITIPPRLDAHRIVEEFMIAANVAAAEELEKHRVPTLYRIHEEPPADKVDALHDFVHSLDLPSPKGQVLSPARFNGLLEKARESSYGQMVQDVVLRTQTQAYYGPDNLGHFGLALNRYAHFTSPIRRYADLIVHRGLVRALGLGGDALTDAERAALADIGEHISNTERRAMAAERDSKDRYLANYLSDHEGEQFAGRITGVTRFGLFVMLQPSGGDGLIPISSIGNDFYSLDEARHALVGERSGETFQLGDAVQVRLLEVNEITGGLRLTLLEEDGSPRSERGGPRRGSGRGGPGRKGAPAKGKGAKGKIAPPKSGKAHTGPDKAKSGAGGGKARRRR